MEKDTERDENLYLVLKKKNKTKQYERLCTTVIATKSTLIFYDIGSIWAGAH